MHPCERCNKPATIHLTEVSEGQLNDTHLCNACAEEAGHVRSSRVPMNELLEQFLKHAQMPIEKKQAVWRLNKE